MDYTQFDHETLAAMLVEIETELGRINDDFESVAADLARISRMGTCAMTALNTLTHALREVETIMVLAADTEQRLTADDLRRTGEIAARARITAHDQLMRGLEQK